ncbi:MAG: efflux RND transporter periplasmic adaptor subunit [Gammaproteobacteria bacterium]|nr:efflux RND transporter periplasmic adaptor subunit [Gammaproteobacteria bacterium]
MPRMSTLCVLTCVLSWALAHNAAAAEIQISAAQAKSMGIETAPVSTQKLPAFGFPAQVVIPAGQLQVVSAPLSGLVTETLAAPNQAVHKGQPLLRLQSPALVEAQRGFLQALMQERLQRENSRRDERLFNEGIIANSRYLTSRNSLAEAEAALAERRNMLRLSGMSTDDVAKLQSQHALTSVIDIRAPLDAVVLEQMVQVGQRVETAAPLYKVAQLTPLWLEISAPLDMLATVAEGAPVTVPAHQAAGKILSVGRSVAAGSQTVMLRAEVTEGAARLRAGQMVEAVLSGDVSAKGAQWNVPNAALTRQQGKAFVFVQTPSGFRVQEVTVIREGADSSVISVALRGDERIAVRGVVALKGAWQGLGGTE